MKAYYNEHDPKAAAWLRELIKEGFITDGYVDERSITDVRGSDLAGYDRVHWFAGIGGWELALQLAGWPADKPVWTGSCPCQPFSAAGKGQGHEDERHLWPAFFQLIRECRPNVVFGEQVENAIRHGWLDGIQADLEGENYAVGHCVLGAHSAGAPHIRQRLYWVADSGRECDEPGRRIGIVAGKSGKVEAEARQRQWCGDANCDSSSTRGLEHASSDGREQRRAESGGRGASGVGNATSGQQRGSRESGESGRRELPTGGSSAGSDGMANAEASGPSCGGAGEILSIFAGGGEQGAWSDFDLIPCRDGKSRRIESGTFPLAHGIPGRVGLLRGYGNAIVPQVAAQFIRAYQETALQIL